MTLREDLNVITPRLRRYARALVTGHPEPSDVGDEIVQATLMRALGARHVGGRPDLVIRLYATVTQLHREVVAGRTSAMAAGAGASALTIDRHPAPPMFSRETALSKALTGLPLEDREALLLVTLEGFDHTEAARILRISRSVLLGRLTRARTAMEASLATAPQTAPQGRRSVPYLRVVT